MNLTKVFKVPAQFCVFLLFASLVLSFYSLYDIFSQVSAKVYVLMNSSHWTGGRPFLLPLLYVCDNAMIKKHLVPNDRNANNIDLNKKESTLIHTLEMSNHRFRGLQVAGAAGAVLCGSPDCALLPFRAAFRLTHRNNMAEAFPELPCSRQTVWRI